MPEETKHHWSSKETLASFIAIATIVGFLFTLDARYVHAEDNKKQTTEVHQKIDKTQESVKDTQKLVEQTTANLRRSMLEDKVFEIDVKNANAKKMPALDSALKERYLRQLSELPKSDMSIK